MSLSTTLSNIGSLTQNPTTAQTLINNNFTAINTALANGVALNAQAPNQMTANLDMNSNAILNLPSPSTNNSPVRLVDVNNLVGGGTINISNLNTGLTINPTALTVNPGLIINQSLSGAAGATPLNSVNVTSDNAAGAFLTDLNITHSFGGAAATGTRVSNFAWLIQTAITSASNTSRNYVGLEGISQTNSGDGGTGLAQNTAKGAYFGSNMIARNSATNIYNMTGTEFDLMSATGSSAYYSSGISIANYEAVQGTGIDAAAVIYSGGSIAASGGGGPWGPGIGFKSGILFAELGANGLVPISSSGSILTTHLETLPNIPVTNGIDLRGFSISNSAFLSNGFNVDGLGGVHAFNLTSIPAGGSTGVGYGLSVTSNFGIYFGSGAPTLSAAQGSLYLRSDGNSTSTRLYVNTNGSTTWTAVTTVA